MSLLDDGPLLSGAEAEFVSVARVSRLATTYPDGAPHVVPICHVLDLDRIVFATERDTQKVRNIDAGSLVSICVDEYDEDWSLLRQVLVHGEAYALDAGLEFDRDRTLLYEKFPQYERESPIEEGTSLILEVRIDRVASWGF